MKKKKIEKSSNFTNITELVNIKGRENGEKQRNEMVPSRIRGPQKMAPGRNTDLTKSLALIFTGPQSCPEGRTEP